jgi:hypothetical protein
VGRVVEIEAGSMDHTGQERVGKTSRNQSRLRGLQRLWQAWKRLARLLGDVIGRVVLTVFFFTVLVPFGLGVRLFGDPLGLNARGARYWKARGLAPETLEGARRLF